jgi:intracellular sulfur oxidation DsrE/DsrF family protein
MKFINKLMGAVLGGAMVVGAMALPATAAARDKLVTPKLVIQVSDADPAYWNLALNNAKNVQKDLGREAIIEIVAYGPGIGMLTADSVVADRVKEAVDSGMKVVACGNTMRAKKLNKEDMNPKVGFVSAGVVEIMDRQMDGYSYIRP